MEIKVTIPTELKEIRLSQYQKLLRVTKDIEDEALINRYTVGILCNLSDDKVKLLPKRHFDEILKTVSNTIMQDGKFKPIVNHKGKEYGFIPDLEDITVGEQADIDGFINDWQKMDRVMAILYRPIKTKKKDKYLIEDYTGKEEPLDLDMETVQGAMVFFYSLLNDLLSCTQSFIKREVHRPQVLRLLEENGVGIKTFMESLEATFLNLRQYLNLNSMRP